MEPLKSNPKRQAIPTLKGYSYQIWRSLLSWIDLQEGQSLFLEGAEDIDLYTSDSVEVTQVKEISESGTLTLRSSDSIEAINNFWEHQNKNKEVRIKFKFLTTAERGSEKPNPFGNVCGLDFWDSCKYPGSDNTLLRLFLTSTESISPELRNFVTTATNEEVRQKLILPIEWNTANKKQEFIEEIVNRKISEHGYWVDALSPSESQKVIPILYKYVWEIVRRKEERWLTQYDFLTIFEDSTRELVSKEKLRELEAFKALKASLPLSSGSSYQGEAGKLTGVLESFSVPDLSNLVSRNELIQALRRNINKHGIIAVTGSTGVGKSTLAYFLAQTTEGNWRKIDLRECTPQEIKARLNAAALDVENRVEQVDCIIDDLNFDLQPNVYVNALSKLIFALKLRHGRLVITSQNPLPVRIKNQHEISEESLFSVPFLDAGEIRELAAKNDCPDNRKLTVWTAVILAQTSGHPLLAHAQILSLKYKGWSLPTAEDLVNNQEIKDVKQEFRKNLINQLPVDARKLLYRLSIFIGKFTRRQVLEMARRKTAIELPGESFDLLIGPWVESVDRDHFRMSPLLSNAAQEEFLPEEIKKLHSAAATTYLQERILDSSDIDAILKHGLLGNNPFPMIRLVPMIFAVEEQHKRSLAESISWFTLIKIEPGETFFSGHLTINNLLRSLQFFILSETGSANPLPVVQNWEREIKKGEDQFEKPGLREQTMFHFLTDVLLEFRLSFNAGQISDWVVELASLLKNPEKFSPDDKLEESKFLNSIRGLDKIGLYVRAAILRCQNPSEVVQLLKTWNESTDDALSEVWSSFENETDLSTSVANKIWLKEANNINADWNKCLENFDLIIDIAARNQVASLIGACYESKAVIYQEYLNDTDQALQQLAEGEEKITYAHKFLKYYRARIYQFQKQYEEALVIFRQISADYEKDKHTGRFLLYRYANHCAAHLGNWGEAAELAIKGKDSLLLTTESDQILAVGFQAEYAYDLWQNDDRELSFREFVKIATFFQEFPGWENNPLARQLYKRVIYTVGKLLDTTGWLPQALNNSLNTPLPEPGWISDFELSRQAEEPVKSKANLWMLLANIEYKLNLGQNVFQQFEQINQFSGDLGTTAILEFLRLQHALNEPDLENLIPYWISYYQSLKINPQYSSENCEFNPGAEEFLKQVTLAALFVINCKKRGELLPLEKWSRDLFGANLFMPGIGVWFANIYECSKADESELIRILKDMQETRERRILAALLISVSDTVDLENRFFANVSLITSNSIFTTNDEVNHQLEILIVDRWKQILEKERFALLSPNIFAGEILSACDDETLKGISKAAKVLICANNAVNTRLSGEILEDLNSLTRHSLIQK